MGSVTMLTSKSQLTATHTKRRLSRLSPMRRARYFYVYLSLLPIFLLFAVVRIIPIAQAFWLSLTNWTLTSKTQAFVGLANYRRLLSDDYFLTAFRNTSVYAVAVVLGSILIAVPLAALLASRLKFTGFYQALFFLPYVMPLVPVSIAWKWIYDAQYGLLNYALSLVGIPRVGWLLRPETALWAIIIMSIWKALGYNLVILLVGMRNIPTVFYEAANIDGAAPYQRFRYITMPLLRPIILYLLVVSTIGAFNVFTQVYVMTTGSQAAPSQALRVLVYEIYQNGFGYFRMGYASAQAVVLTLVVLALTFIQFRVVPSRETVY